MLNLTPEQVAQMLQYNPNGASWCQPMMDIFPKYGITTVERIAGFVSQTAYESRYYTALEEDLHYTAATLERIWPNLWQTRNVNDYAMQPQKIANLVYANIIGNGPEESGDGWNYRGRGIIQLTGKYNYEQFGNSIGMPLQQVVSYLTTQQGALESACWYWNSRNINAAADNKDVVGMTRAINPGLLGLPQREQLYTYCIGVLNG